MRLILVQHGEAVDKAQDANRPLTERGRRDVDALSTALSQAEQLPREVLHSGKTRARQSAEALSVGTAPKARDGLGPTDPVAAFAGELAGRSEDLMLVGHQPFLGKLASRLLAGDEEAVAVGFVPGTAVCLERGEDGRWSLIWALRPDVLPTG